MKDVTVTEPVGPARAEGPTSSRWTRRALWSNLVAQIGIIVTGGAVRLTGSGLGCSTWPQCEPGQFTPEFHEAMSIHSLIEFGNRTLTGVLGVIALVVLVLVVREDWRPRWFRTLAWLPLAGVALQGVVGGITVLVQLHPAVVGVHMLLSIALVAVSAVLLATDHRTRPGAARGFAGGAETVFAGRVLLAVGAALMVLGVIVTGAGPHGGDDEHAYRYELDPVAVAKAHAWIAWAFVLVLAVVVWFLHRDGAPQRVRRTWWWLVAITLAQGAIGYVQYFTGLPEIVVGTHMLGTGLLAASLAWSYSTLRSVRPAPRSRAEQLAAPAEDSAVEERRPRAR